jgi:Tfp pilus assembly protein PilO
MMRARTQADLIANGLIVTSLLVVVALAIFMKVSPAPTVEGLAKAKQLSRNKVDQEIALAKAQNRQLTASIDAHTWPIPADQVGPQALAKVTALAKSHNVKLVAFRPQKQNDAEGLIQLPFLILVDGQFTSVMQFMKDLDKTDTKLAVSLVQMASADEATDRVTASVGAAAYLKPTKGGTGGKAL